ncbi:lipase family protein [Williamsia sp.]|uniref:lipase family protein n=1 Tax=Williamsia sp. TaxID=1872085 RepID=UPI001A1F1102|nr:lipase family protein [Williamsia sp.]MBJ7290507.1 triacylglycerol lipase [Williamsia sp.]
MHITSTPSGATMQRTVLIRRGFAATLRACTVVLLVAVAAMTSTGAARAAPAAPPRPVTVTPALPFPIPPTLPEFDTGFYRPAQAVVDARRPGEIIAARRVNLAYNSILPITIDAWQLSFRSTDTHGRAIPAVTTVMKPRGSSARPRPLLSYQSAEDSLGQYCRPSYVMQQASLGILAGAAETNSLFVVPIAAMEMGWAVAVTDTQGPRQAFGAGPLEGRITLDGIRAAENFAPMRLSGAATKVGMAGYSGGAIATGHAAELHRSYAPELTIVGAAEGGIPADVGAALRMASNNAGSGIIFAGAIGASREYPELADLFRRYLTPFGRGYVAAKENLCQIPTAVVLPFVNLEGMFSIPRPFDDPRARRVIDHIAMGHSVPDMPMFMLHSNPDWLVPVGPVNALVRKYCADPTAQVQYLRDNFSEHISLDLFALPLFLRFLKDRFDGVPAQRGCTTSDAGSVLLAPQLWSTLLPAIAPVILDLLGKPVGR